MIKTKFGSIFSHKFNNEYICYDTSIQPILKSRIIDSLKSDEFRLSNRSNILDLNNGFIKKHFWRKGAVSVFNDNYIFLGLKSSRPIRELINYIDFLHIVKASENQFIIDKIEVCTPIFAYIKKNTIFYKGDIILSKINGMTLDAYLQTRNMNKSFEMEIAHCFGFMFSNGIYNFDMNLKNIIYNTDSQKLAFIDFDKALIDSAKKNNKKYITRVLNKFKRSLEYYKSLSNFNYNKFINYL